ncbi:MAG: SDR family oxidoreductase [Gammaproteobacteria bacterium TMED112]|nr:MAG: SDR family oxidoreductase [Gammaproteobacteria bacterium TMED112]|tara:strand:- start:4224 stop:4952 length:729 start_codon:yes stop_codon:yes gene_type:complete
MANKVLITGGAQRIGKALVKHFHQIGWNIIFQYRSSKSEAESIKEELNSDRADSCEIIQCDFDDNVSCKLFYAQLESKLEGLTSLINNASTFYPKKLSETSHEDWIKLTSSNLYLPIFLSKFCAPELIKNKGNIVNIADIHAEQGLKNYTVYTAAKAGLMNFTKSLAKELAPNVLVNSVSPGAILWDVNEPSEDKKNEILASIPMKRIGDENDIVAIINYLLTKNTYMTGRNINIDGGKSLG